MTLVFPERCLHKASLNILEATLGSSAESGSSSKNISESEYRARASPILARYPPLSVAPPSPITVLEPLGRARKSASRQASLDT